jgi:hypothetical protein
LTLATFSSATPAGSGFSPYGPGASGSSSLQGVAETVASVSFLVNSNPLVVTGISYDRTGSTTGTLNFSAWNALQRIDVYCFSFNEQSGFNYQFSHSINYSTRPDSLTAWSTVRAVNWGTVTFDCCVAPLTDSVIAGDYSGNFASANPYLSKNTGNAQDLTVSGNFNLLFNPNHPCHRAAPLTSSTPARCALLPLGN